MQDASVHGQRRQVFLRIVAADHVEDHIGAMSAGDVAHDGDKVFRPVIHRRIGAEGAAGVALLR